jgi:hypothetical protein
MSHIDEGRLAAYLDGELPAGSGELVEIELHVAACADCRKLLEESLKHRNRARAILRSGSPSTTEAPAFDEILRRAGKSGASRGIAPERSRLASLAWAATIVLAIGAGWYVTRERTSGPIATALRKTRPATPTPAETTVVLAERTNEAEPATDTKREETAPAAAAPAPATAVPSPSQAGARADELARAALPERAPQPPAAIALEPQAKAPATPPAIAGQALAAGAAPKSGDSGAADRLAKKDVASDAGAATGQIAMEQKRAEKLAAPANAPSAARERAAPAAAPAPVPLPPAVWRETSQGGAMRQLGRLPLQVAELPVLAYYVRPTGAPEIRVTHDLGQGQVLEVIQSRVMTDSATTPEARNEAAGFVGTEITEETGGYRTTLRGPVSRDSLSALLRKLR